MLLLILNWFFHQVYWNEHLAGLHGRKKRSLIGGRPARRGRGQWSGWRCSGFTSVYREGFETVLFLQALVLEAGHRRACSRASLVGLAATAAVGFADVRAAAQAAAQEDARC